MKKVLFIDRDGTLVIEPPEDYQLDSFEKLEFYPNSITYLSKVANDLDYELVMITNQDGLGSDSFPENTFWPVHNFIIKTMKNEGIAFQDVFIDRTFAKDNTPTRKPNTGLLTKYMNEEYDLENSYVIGDRLTDMQLAYNLGAKGILIQNENAIGQDEVSMDISDLDESITLKTSSWKAIYEYLKLGNRNVSKSRITNETKVFINMNLDGSGIYTINTGIDFFDHMLAQLARHGGMDLEIKVQGDLAVDEHHTIEDTAITIGEALNEALGNKLGIERYGFTLPMDDCLAQVAIDFGGRNWLVWDADFKREMIGKMPTEMFFHFFKSFSDAAKCNLNIKAEGTNEHHKIESIFKALAKAIKAAVKRDSEKLLLPTTKGTL